MRIVLVELESLCVNFIFLSGNLVPKSLKDANCVICTTIQSEIGEDTVWFSRHTCSANISLQFKSFNNVLRQLTHHPTTECEEVGPKYMQHILYVNL